MPVKDWLPAAVRLAATDRKLKAGEPLFHLGDKTGGLYEVIAGRVRLTRVDRSGRETVLYVAGPGETIAEASLFSPVYHCDAAAGSDAVVRLYPKPAVLAAFAKDRKAAQAFSATLARQVMSLRTRFRNLGNVLAQDKTQVEVFTLESPGISRQRISWGWYTADLEIMPMPKICCGEPSH